MNFKYIYGRKLYNTNKNKCLIYINIILEKTLKTIVVI
ncbi:hypothetical protein CLC_1786 [Clostridium botulinum A str. Hall]|nr:hypothetical protein CLB_1779 [Clostridium botulinum A str. ATCC 19397]ABS39068.1 hypothetical protein CLC_1786 [Clostridium botulinum A str. Hall]KON11202.1 hypothetical protein ACP52_03635 [Clostridium botulinum]KOR53296.1 hypothetical protein ADT23_09735 [Clostridium botulinum]